MSSNPLAAPHSQDLPRGRMVALDLLAAPLAAACVHMAASALDRPRALASPAALLDPLAATLAVLLVAELLLLLLLRPLLRRVFGRGAGPAALGALLVLAAALLPLVEAMGRRLSGQALAAAWCVAGLAALCGAGAAGLLVERAGRASEEGSGEQGASGVAPGIAAGVALLSAGLLAAAWAVAFPPAVPAWGIALAFGALGLLFFRPGVGAPAGPPAVLGLLVATILAPFGLRLVPDGAQRTGPTGTPPDGAPPAVLLITVDTLRPDFLSARAPLGVPTPALDELLAASVVFENARAAAPWTKPSVASILTGLSPWVHGVTSVGVRLPDEVETLAEAFRDAGYRTAGIGSNVHLEPIYRFDQGFDDYLFPARPEYGTSIGARALRLVFPERYPELFPSTRAIGEVALRWIEENSGEPFFLWVHILDPHWPYAPPARHVPGASAHPQRRLFWGDPETVTGVQAGRVRVGEAEREWIRELYRGEIRYVDETLGSLLWALRERGLIERSLVAFTSDHGEEFWEHGAYEHGHTLYDEVLRVPLAVKLPGGERAGERIGAAVSTVSLAPTLLELCGLDSGRRESGVLLRSMGEEAEASTEPGESVLTASGTFYFGEKSMVLLDGRYKYVLHTDPGREELFDLVEDPRELHSVAASRPELLERARLALAERIEAAARLRGELGIPVPEAVGVGGAEIERLRELGYAGAD